ncbi:type II toxin-antitoxin system VapC family toxin [Herbiconiux sp. P15]|uniref:type II toxin-antitoxin system VapC family toxin n=1 Tax=Herbiconiux liukaitaii TaxID=3342799 RepID=UPI0035B6FC62
MIVADTNVLSEILRDDPDESVAGWFERCDQADFYTTAVTLAEMLAGLSTMAAGSRRHGLADQVARLFGGVLDGRVLPFDSASAVEYAEVIATRRRIGRPISPLDAQIAAIARVHGASVATRNGRDFEGAGVTVVDPWGA